MYPFALLPPPHHTLPSSLLPFAASGPPARSHGGISSRSRTAAEQSRSSDFSSRVHQKKYPSVYHSSLHQEKCIPNCSSSPRSPVRQMHEYSTFHLLGSGFGLLCFCKADEETNKFWEHMYSWLESLKFIAAVLLLLLWIQSQSLVLSPDFLSGELCLLQTKLAWR